MFSTKAAVEAQFSFVFGAEFLSNVAQDVRKKENMDSFYVRFDIQNDGVLC